MTTIFISHSSADNALAQELAARLKQQGHQRVFLDFDAEKGIVAGRSWERTLYRKLRACEVVIALCTDNYLASQWCFAEIALARMESKPIVAIKADPLAADAQLPSILTERQFLDLRTDRDDAYRRLFRGLAELDPLGAAIEWDPKASPYLGLDAFGEQHAAVFFGREREIRQGIQLLDRGAPGLILVLGASGSGKSSLVRAGIVPRLRLSRDNWLVVDPVRPGRDPFGALADALARRFRAAGDGKSGESLDASALKATLSAWQPPQASNDLPSADGPRAAARAARLDRLMAELLALEQQARDDADTSLTAFLNWSVEDLRRICTRDSEATEPIADATPLNAVAQRLRRLSDRPDARVLLVIDQFEELLGAASHDPAGRRLLALLAASLASDPGLLSVMGTLRSDFFETFQRTNSQLGIDFETLSLGPIPVEGIRRVIEAPARLGAIELEPGLADRLIADADSADALPLLSFTLWRMWQERGDDGAFTLHDYQRIGGLSGAIAGEADALLQIARQRQQVPALRRAFQTMVRLADDGQFARKPVAWDSPALEPVHDLLTRFADRRLLTFRSEDGVRMIEVAHESLFRTWAPLRNWVDEQRAELVLRHQLTQSSRIWNAEGRRTDDLWRGARLAQAQDLLEQGRLAEKDSDTSTARAFVQASEALRRRQARRRRNIVAGVTTVLLVFLAYAIRNEDIAKAQQRSAAAQQWSLAASRDLATDPMKSLELARGAVCLMRAFDTPVPDSAYNALNRAVQAAKRQRSLTAHRIGVTDLAYVTAAPDAGARQRLLSLDGSGTRLDWSWAGTDATSCAPSPPPNGKDGSVRVMAVDPSGRYVALATVGSVQIEAQPVDGRAATQNKAATTLPGDVTHLRFGPASRQLAVADVDGHMQIVPLSPDAAPGPVVAIEPLDGRLGDLIFSDDGGALIAGSWAGPIAVRDVSDGSLLRRLRGHTEAVSTLATHDTYLASGSWDQTVRLWDLRSGASLHVLGHDAMISGLAFVDIGGAAPLLVSASWDGNVSIWDVASGTLQHNLSHAAPVTALAVAPREDTADDPLQLATGDWDGHTRLWNVDRGPAGTVQARQIARHAEPVTALVFSANGRQLASGSDDTTIRVTQLRDQATALDWHSSLDLKRVETGQTWFAVLVADGVRVLDAGTGRQQRLVTGYEGTARAIAFDTGEDGAKLVVDADRNFDFYLDERELMYCADRLADSPTASVPLAQYHLDSRCDPDDFGPGYQSLMTRARLFFDGLF